MTKRHFKCTHTYQASPARGYSAELTVKDGDGGMGKITLPIAIP